MLYTHPIIKKIQRGRMDEYEARLIAALTRDR
jgi:hypothetical protein